MSIRTLAARMEWAGGDQLGRINKQKLNSLRSALKSSYNTRQLKTPDKTIWPGLLTENNLKPDYDKKVLSVEFDSGLKAGDVVEMLHDHSFWMIYLPHLTETAYLQADVIRCRYSIDIEGKEYWIYFQGPTETDLSWYQKDNIAYNKPNLSGTIYITKDETTEDYFSRFQKIKLDGHNWEIQVVDRISVPGIIELEIQETFDNYIAELPKIQKVDYFTQIVGETLVRQDTIQGYKIDAELYNPDYKWVVEGNKRVELLEELDGGRCCTVKVHPGAIRTYRVKYTNGVTGYYLDAKIDIEKQLINGDAEVHPYDIKKYSCKEDGVFWLDTKYAKITEQTSKTCTVEILRGKSGEFTLYFKESASGEVRTLPIKIKPF